MSDGIIIKEEGCMSLLDSIRLFSIPFAQVLSHEGFIIWAISPEDYYEHQSLLDKVKVTERKFEMVDRYDDGQGYDSTTNTYFDVRNRSIMRFGFSDGEDEDVDLVRALMMAGIIESRQYEKRTLTTV